MKKFKFPSLLLGLALAVMCAFAFTPHPVVNNTKSTVQYYYHGPDQNIVNLQNPANWDNVSASCASSGSKVCGIIGSDDRPTFDASLLTYANQSQMLTASNFQKR